MLTGVISEFSTRGFSVLCSGDSANTGALRGCVFYVAMKSVMDWRDKDYQSPALNKFCYLFIEHIISELQIATNVRLREA
jgi:hypothetical protein